MIMPRPVSQFPTGLKETERQLRDMEQAARAGSWQRNLLTDELQWSDQMHGIMGFSTEEPAPNFETFLARVPPEDRPLIDRMEDQAVHRGTSEGEYRIILPDGTIRFLHERAKVDLDAEGRPIRLIGVTQDITERRTLERQLRQTEKFAALGTLMAGVAHELNNPLFAVTGYIELMTEKVQRGRYGGPGLADDLAALSQATGRAMAIVQRCLGAARTAAPHREPIAVNALLEHALNLAANDLRINRIAVKTEFAEDLLPAIGDAEGLLQVCLNLFTNARQSMAAAHGGGTLQVTTRLVRTPTGPRVEVRVRDDGGGIAPEHLPLVFEPFFTTKPVGEGTGLGLSLCHRIVTELGGTLSCESRPGQGAAFVVELPPAEEKVPVPPREEDCSVAGYRSCQDSHHDG